MEYIAPTDFTYYSVYEHESARYSTPTSTVCISRRTYGHLSLFPAGKAQAWNGSLPAMMQVIFAYEHHQ